jgi:hypothetical protein
VFFSCLCLGTRSWVNCKTWMGPRHCFLDKPLRQYNFQSLRWFFLFPSPFWGGRSMRF